MGDLNQRCLHWKHQDVPVELQGTWHEQAFLTPPSVAISLLKEKVQSKGPFGLKGREGE